MGGGLPSCGTAATPPTCTSCRPQAVGRCGSHPTARCGRTGTTMHPSGPPTAAISPSPTAIMSGSSPSDGGLPRKVTSFTTLADIPRWMPDNYQLLVTVERDDRTRIVLTDRDGSWPRPVSEGPGHDHSPQASPDGRYVAYLHGPLEDLDRTDIMLADLETGMVRPLTGVAGAGGHCTGLVARRALHRIHLRAPRLSRAVRAGYVHRQRAPGDPPRPRRPRARLVTRIRRGWSAPSTGRARSTWRS